MKVELSHLKQYHLCKLRESNCIFASRNFGKDCTEQQPNKSIGCSWWQTMSTSLCFETKTPLLTCTGVCNQLDALCCLATAALLWSLYTRCEAWRSLLNLTQHSKCS